MLRLLFGVGGNASVAGANMLVALLIMRHEIGAVYGAFSLIVVLQAFINALSNAVFSTTLLFNAKSSEVKQEATSINNAFSMMGAALVFSVAVTNFEVEVAWMIFLFSVIQSYRWFGRIYLLNDMRPKVVAVSDYVYSLVVVIGVAVIWLDDGGVLIKSILLMILALLLSCLYLYRVDAHIYSLRLVRDFPCFKSCFKTRTVYSIQGVFWTELASNGHAYFIVFVLGASAYAPVAAALLLMRPVNIAIQAITQMERPRIRGLLRLKLAGRESLNRYFGLCLAIYGLTLVLVWIFIIYRPDWYAKADSDVFHFAVIVFLVASGLRILRGGLSMYVQTLDGFWVISRAMLSVALFYWVYMYVLIDMIGRSIITGVLFVEVIVSVLLYLWLRKKEGLK